MQPWWEIYPERLRWEINELESAGYVVEKLNDFFENDEPGALKVVPTRGIFKDKEFIIKFPHFYPYFKFEVESKDFDLYHHQNPFSNNLCLIGQDPEKWSINYSVAKVLNDFLPDVVSAGSSENAEDVKEIEEDQAEPFSSYYQTEPQSYVLLDGNWLLPDEFNKGKLTIGLMKNISNIEPIKSAILDIKDDKSTVLFNANSSIKEIYNVKRTGYWFKVGRPYKTLNPKDIIDNLYSLGLKKQAFKNPSPILIGVNFPEEISRRKYGQGWIFIANRRIKKKVICHSFVTPQRIGKNDLSLRFPQYKILNTKKIGVVGLGCLGAPSAIEFARCGVGNIKILDCDVVDAGTIVRWPLGFPSIGKLKTIALSEFINQNYPYIHIQTYTYNFGSVYGDCSLSDIEDFLLEIDLLYDTSTNFNINYLLSKIAKTREIPYISIAATYGAWGGHIVRIQPQQTEGCWSCFRGRLENKSINYAVSDSNGIIQPQGCAAPTYTGASFDTAEIVNGGVRTAISTLTSEEEDQYPPINWDIAIINLRNNKGGVIPPTWETYKLKRYKNCPCCGIPK